MPMDRSKYPKDWPALSRAIRERAEQRCECRGVCGDEHDTRCDAPNGAIVVRRLARPEWWSLLDRTDAGQLTVSGPPVRVVLTVAHLDHDTRNNDAGNLAALCQRCHLKLDAAQHAANAAATRRSRKAVAELPGLASTTGPGAEAGRA